MEIISKPKCEVCKQEKRETNHWFMAAVRSILVIKPLPAHLSADDVRDYVALCGQSCVSKYVSSNIDELHKHPF